MPTKRIFGVMLGAIASVAVIFYFQKHFAPSINEATPSETLIIHPQEKMSKSPGLSASSEVTPKTVSPQSNGSRRASHEVIESNFEDVVTLCFQGEACELKEEPWQFYLKLKNTEKKKTMDSLISYLRKELKNPELKERYKDPLKKMIDDFYQGRDRDFQDAAYYYYLGDLDTSLKLYLDMEKTAAKDPSYLGPPKLNIANDLYELRRWSEALTYYRQALDEVLSEKWSGPDQQRQIHFVQDRINELEKK